MGCKTCNGTGEYRSGLHRIPCPGCDGTGESMYAVQFFDRHIGWETKSTWATEEAAQFELTSIRSMSMHPSWWRVCKV